MPWSYLEQSFGSPGGSDQQTGNFCPVRSALARVVYFFSHLKNIAFHSSVSATQLLGCLESERGAIRLINLLPLRREPAGAVGHREFGAARGISPTMTQGSPNIPMDLEAGREVQSHVDRQRRGTRSPWVTALSALGSQHPQTEKHRHNSSTTVRTAGGIRETLATCQALC